MKIFTQNKKANFDYLILEKFSAGIVLTGREVKSIRGGRINLLGSYVSIRNNEVFLINADIPPYQPENNLKDYNSKRDRKLLLTKKEINQLLGKIKEKGLTLVPIKVYTIKTKIKLEFGIGKGKKKRDKREDIKKRDIEREISRQIIS